MKIGDIVIAKKDKHLLGEVLAIDDMDRVTVKLCENGLEVMMDMTDLLCTGSNQPKRESDKTVNILGTEYKILIVEEGDYRYEAEADGWCDMQAKEILLYNYKQDFMSVKDLVSYQKKVLRHEIIHAFFYESGLANNTLESKNWIQNEEMVDWFAIQEPKIHKAFIEADCE